MALNNLIRFRKGIATEWSGQNPILASGEPGYDGTNNLLKVGDGDTNWLNLSPVNSNISGYNFTASTGIFDVISFDVNNESSLTKGQINWDDTEGTMDIGLTDNTTIHIGSHRYFRIRNETGGTLYKGQVVYASGVHANGIIEPALYVADGTVREVRLMGIILEDINHQNNGYAIDFGHLEEMDLDGSATNYAVGDETWVAGDILYVHPTAAGKLTKVEPKHSISVAIVLDPGNGNGNGRMFVRPTSYGHLNDNHDVDTSGLLDNQFLVYNSGLDYWQPSSGLYYLDGNVGIGTASPSEKLHVNGNVLVDNSFYTSPTGTIIGTSGWIYQSGQQVLSNGSFGTHIGDAQFSQNVLRAQTTDATLTNLTIGTQSGILLASNRTYNFTVNIVGRRTNGQDNAGYKLEGLLVNDGYGTQLLGNPIKTTFYESDTSWDTQVSVTGAGAGGTDYLLVQCQGASSKNINWVAHVDMLEAGGNIDGYTEAYILDGISSDIIP